MIRICEYMNGVMYIIIAHNIRLPIIVIVMVYYTVYGYILITYNKAIIKYICVMMNEHIILLYYNL